jgi:peptidoglycan/LPS O-acetylase OafA/YrhL
MVVTMPPAIPPTSHNWNRIDGIDLLRGLSIFFVLMNHVNMRLLIAKIPYTQGLPAQLVSPLVWNGQFGVQIFFVVSGFLITSTSLRRWQSPEDKSLARLSIPNFYRLRFARIAPLMLALLAVLSILHLCHVDGYIVSQKTGGLGRALVAALTFHINYLEAARGYLPGNWDILWSLSVEEMFYLFFPLLARLLSKKQLFLPLLGLFILAGPFARAKAFNPNPVWREYSYLGGMDAIAIGCLTAILLSNKRLSRTAIHACAWSGAALLIFVLCFSIQTNHWGLGRNGLDMTILALGAALAITAAAQSEWQAPRILAPLKVLGQRSYEIYLTHMFAVMALFALFLRFGKPMLAVPLLFLSMIAASGLLGWLVAVYFAEPMNRWLRRRTGAGEFVLGAAIPEAD